MTVTVESHEGRPIGVSLPDQVTLEVVEADPVVKGQTAASSYKPAKLENGVRVLVPPFVSAWASAWWSTPTSSLTSAAPSSGVFRV